MVGGCYYSQSPAAVKIKKYNSALYFYQKGTHTDTISKTKGNIFYLVANDSLKSQIHIFIENGQLVKTKNDSVFKFVYVKGMSYECFFLKIFNENKWKFETLVNGTTSERPDKVIFRVKKRNESVYLIENKFSYLEK